MTIRGEFTKAEPQVVLTMSYEDAVRLRTFLAYDVSIPNAMDTSSCFPRADRLKVCTFMEDLRRPLDDLNIAVNHSTLEKGA